MATVTKVQSTEPPEQDAASEGEPAPECQWVAGRAGRPGRHRGCGGGAARRAGRTPRQLAASAENQAGPQSDDSELPGELLGERGYSQATLPEMRRAEEIKYRDQHPKEESRPPLSKGNDS